MPNLDDHLYTLDITGYPDMQKRQVAEFKENILYDLLALLPRPNLIHLHDPLDQIPALCVPCAQLASLEHIRTAIKKYVEGKE